MAEQKTLIEQVARGLAIFAQYPNCHIAAKQDAIHAGMDDPTLLPAEEARELLKLGWRHTELGWARWLA